MPVFAREVTYLVCNYVVTVYHITLAVENYGGLLPINILTEKALADLLLIS